MTAAVLLLLHLGLPTPAEGAAEPLVSPDVADSPSADLELLEEVRRIAARVESLRGQRFAARPLAVRAPEPLRRAAIEARLSRGLAPRRIEARGRAWEDLGLGTADTPRRLLRRLAEDVEGAVLDRDGPRLLVAPELVVTGEDAPPGEAAADPLLDAGTRPEALLLAHVLVHALQQQRRDAAPPASMTDRILTEAAWAEAEANLVAVRYLFRTVGVGDEALEHGIEPERLIDGRLAGAPLGDLPAAERTLLDLVYGEGFIRAARVYREGGWRALEHAARARVSSRDLLHLDRPPLGAAAPGSPPASPLPGELDLADTDSLGEQGVIALVSTLTGKIDLALAAADGWTGDVLTRWESERQPAEGLTLWQTRWESPEQAAEFEYALGRCLEDGLHAVAIERPTAQRWFARVGTRAFRVARDGASVTIRIAPALLDARLERSEATQKAPHPAKKTSALKE